MPKTARRMACPVLVHPVVAVMQMCSAALLHRGSLDDRDHRCSRAHASGPRTRLFIGQQPRIQYFTRLISNPIRAAHNQQHIDDPVAQIQQPRVWHSRSIWHRRDRTLAAST